uniref:Uncharacterized protein n=1 Tax=viral metagenome TaxID=1070528 RepID=A0A6M3J9U1_9ZZZZ
MTEQGEIGEKLHSKPHFLNWRDDLTKKIGGKDTGVPCITIFVDEKVDRQLLTNRQAIPKEIDGMPTDVVALAAEDFELGLTSVAQKTPAEQKRMLGLKKCK